MMSLIITVSKAEVQDIECFAASHGLFQKITETREHFLLVPKPGKLSDSLSLFTKKQVAYHVSNSARELLQGEIGN